MPRKQPRRPALPQPRSAALYAQLLLFPERAEFLEQLRYRGYRIRLDHWRDLSTEFRHAFEAVYTRKSASVLLVHGDQGTGKTLFARKIEEDFEIAKQSRDANPDNLWHVLAGGHPIDVQVVNQATATTELRRVEPKAGWLENERRFARDDKREMRVFLLDDVHKDVFLREWADLSQGDYLRLKAEGKEGPVIEAVAQRIVEDCRGDFQRSLFVLLSNDRALLQRLFDALERSHARLARVLELPLPPPGLKEEIVRTNTNRLNQRSYWYCLDQGGPEEKRGAYEVLTGEGGFIDSFQAIDRALGASAKARTGRPANKNLLTLVTLGSEPLAVDAYVTDREVVPDDHAAAPNGHATAKHVGAWLFRHGWASAFATQADDEYARRASLVESEFSLRWVALDMRATWWLCEAPADDPLCQRLVEVIAAFPVIGASASKKRAAREELGSLDSLLDALPDASEYAAFAARFRETGRTRSAVYEPAIASRFGKALSKGLDVLGRVRPDLILGEYRPCAITGASSPESKSIEAALRRDCHVIELTAHLQPDFAGLDDYLRAKVQVYADLLESV